MHEKQFTDIPTIPLSEADRCFLRAVHKTIGQRREVVPREIVAKLDQELPKDFDPKSIDHRLLRFGVDLTLLGAWHANPSRDLIAGADRVIRGIRDMILDDPSRRAVTANDVAVAVGMTAQDVSVYFALITPLGNFSSGSSGIPRWQQILVEGDEVLREYRRYSGIDQVLREFADRWGPASAPRKRLRTHEAGDSRNRVEHALDRLKNHPLVAGVIVVGIVLIAVVSFTGKMSELPDQFEKWRGSRGPEVDALPGFFQVLGRSDASLPEKKLAIDAIVSVSSSDSHSASIVAQRLSDFVRDSCGYTERDSLKQSCELARRVEESAIRDDVEYALQKLGEAELSKDRRGERGASLDLRRISCPKVLLKGRHYERAELADAIFFKANLAEVHFIDCDLSGVVFSGSQLDGSVFDGSSVRQACFVNAILPRARLRDLSLHRVNFQGADLTGAELSGATDYDQVASWSGARIGGIRADAELIAWALEHGALQK